MAANINKSYRSKVVVQAQHFFKVIVSPFDQGLKIPYAFMRKHGRDLGHIVLLKVPTGASWQVELVHYGNGTRLQKGWPEFANYYSIEKLYFLVFRYEGNSEFHVLIFDPTATEIEYPSKTNCDRSGSFDRTFSDEYSINPRTRASEGKRVRAEDAEEDVSVEILEDLPERPRRRTRYSHRLSTEKHRPGRKNSGNPNQDENAGCSKQKMKDESFMRIKNLSPSPTSVSKSNTVIIKKKFKSYQKAKAFTSSKPFFICFIYPSYVSDRGYLAIPTKFAKDYFTTKKECEFILQVSEKIKKWSVIFRPSGTRTISSLGWKKFAEDNGLKVGDVCVFELVPRTRNFNITVYRSAEHGMTAQSCATVKH